MRAFGGRSDCPGSSSKQSHAPCSLTVSLRAARSPSTSCLLARFFPNAEVIAVDQSPSLLERARMRAAERHLTSWVVSQRADVPDEFDVLSPADLIWTSNVVHHLGDQQAALNALAASLRPGGLLAVVERGLPPRFLPRDIDMGRPGLQASLDVATEHQFTALRTQLPASVKAVEDWPALLARAGLIPTGTRTFLTDLPAPLGLPAREHVHARLTRLRDQIGEPARPRGPRNPGTPCGRRCLYGHPLAPRRLLPHRYQRPHRSLLPHGLTASVRAALYRSTDSWACRTGRGQSEHRSRPVGRSSRAWDRRHRSTAPRQRPRPQLMVQQVSPTPPIGGPIGNCDGSPVIVRVVTMWVSTGQYGLARRAPGRVARNRRI
ncbi:class I SAM-dependent methyltransferase [Streptomyces sp. H27-D2]|uniref:class I SAM-dependent methyltransferase n=1 Tax=Streptomyces sp. H27-D2 TaxID=3046304 RepID=UPI002DB7A09B|nr:methyltransferase [Streptomyces sp. H27-D2]MEC4020208.1 methyltransferase [Streptomyces sp. H27-D2]